MDTGVPMLFKGLEAAAGIYFGVYTAPGLAGRNPVHTHLYVILTFAVFFWVHLFSSHKIFQIDLTFFFYLNPGAEVLGFIQWRMVFRNQSLKGVRWWTPIILALWMG